MSATKNFAGTRILVAGGSSGVGLATAKAFASRDANVLIVSRDERRLGAALAEIGANARCATLDLRDDQAVERFCARQGAFDHVVVSAAETPMGSARALPLEDAYAAMNSKFWGAYRLARRVEFSPAGSLTLVSGYLSQRPGKAASLQSAINAALEALARGLAIELAPIRVNTVSPGLMRSPLWDTLSDEARNTMYASAADRLPVRKVGRVEDAADAILYLAGNDYSTGSTVFVDGGGSIA